MDVLSDSLVVRFNVESRSVVIEHASNGAVPAPLVQIRLETYSAMDFDQMAAFLGSRLLLLMPSMRAVFADDIEKMKKRP